MDSVLFDEIIRTDYGQFDIIWSDDGGFDGDDDRFFAGQVNGLVGAADAGGVYLNLARRSGGSRVRLVLRDAEPLPPPAYYEDVVEVSVAIPAGAEVQWLSWAGETFGQLPDCQPGSYRLRVSAHGRDAGNADEFAEGVVDEYMLELWPAAATADKILRVGSENAKYWHESFGGRR